MNKKATIFILDDDDINLILLEESLQDEYNVITEKQKLPALMKIKSYNPDIILLDIMMPEISGYEFYKILKSDIATASIPVIFLSALDDPNSKAYGLGLGAVDYVTKPFNIKEIKIRIENHLKVRVREAELLKKINNVHKDYLNNQEKLKNIMDEYNNIMLRVVTAYSKERTNHILRIKKYTELLVKKYGEKYGESNDSRKNKIISKAAMLHDIGKMTIPDEIINKKSKLLDSEFELIKTHTIAGLDLLNNEHIVNCKEVLEYAGEIIKFHHEKFDGRGYPEGMRGYDIPFCARIVALADVYDALVTPRVYNKLYTHKEALEIISSEKSKHFDPEIVEIFIENNALFEEIIKEYTDENINYSYWFNSSRKEWVLWAAQQI